MLNSAIANSEVDSLHKITDNVFVVRCKFEFNDGSTEFVVGNYHDGEELLYNVDAYDYFGMALDDYTTRKCYSIYELRDDSITVEASSLNLDVDTTKAHEWEKAGFLSL